MGIYRYIAAILEPCRQGHIGRVHRWGRAGIRAAIL